MAALKVSTKPVFIDTACYRFSVILATQPASSFDWGLDLTNELVKIVVAPAIIARPGLSQSATCMARVKIDETIFQGSWKKALPTQWGKTSWAKEQIRSGLFAGRNWISSCIEIFIDKANPVGDNGKCWLERVMKSAPSEVLMLIITLNWTHMHVLHVLCLSCSLQGNLQLWNLRTKNFIVKTFRKFF